MIDIPRAASILNQRYPGLEEVSERVFRAFDRHDDKAYAVRYFDLNDNLLSTAERLRNYQDDLLGTLYFDPKAGSDLRWNHYLYFIISKDFAHQSEFNRAKVAVESNHEYARKQVILEDDLEHILKPHSAQALVPQQLPPDLVSTWMKILDDKGLGFVLDDDIQVPEVSRRIENGKLQRSRKNLSVLELDSAEIEVSRDVINKLTIKGFRKHPIQKEFDFSEVNLIVGANAAGKTSLLEAIEYLYCGKTKRSGRLLRGTAVSAMLQSSNLTLETSPNTDLKKLRARHLAWYGKSELKALNIDETFSKFNFLNTDAAVGLTVEMSKERISQDVAQLLLGAQASKALDRLNRVHRELTETCKSIDKDISLQQLQQREAKDRIDAFLNAPRESDQLFSEFLIALNRLEWKSPPQDKSNSDSLSLPLQEAMTEVQKLEKLELPSKMFEEQILLSAYTRLTETVDTSKNLVKREIEIRELKIQTERQLQPLLGRISAIETLRSFATSGLETILQRQQTLGSSIGALTSALASAKAAEAFSPSQELCQERVSAAVVASHARLTDLRQQAEHAKRNLEDYEKTQADIAALRQKLRSLAQEIISQVQDPDHCPLCHTEFLHGELLEKILFNVDTAEEETSSSLRERLQISDRAVSEAYSQATALEGLEAFIGSEVANTISVAEALERMTNARKQLDAEQDELDVIEVRLRELEASGFSVIRLHELKAAVQIQDALPPAQGFDSLKSGLLETIEKNHKRMASIEKDLHQLEDDSEALAREHGIEVPVSVETLTRQLASKLIVHACALQGVQNLTNVMRLSSGVKPPELSVLLGQAQSLLVQLTTSTAQDAVADAEISKATDNMKKHAKALEDLVAQKQRIKDAQTVLSELLSKYSEQTLSEQILRENGEEIASTFACIHTPNEFDLKTDASGLRIVRRDGEHEVGLHEMSTGQRAAYALSLFLAMNARLQQGPKVLLFDDPIAHVDDINVLSFLDHLRELALKGTRQIFFATADTQLAGLFRHKFRFLGEKRFREITLIRQV